MNKKHLIVFDIDGTLTDSVSAHQSSFIEALKNIGVKNMDTNFKDYKHHTDSYIAKVIYELDTKSIFDKKVWSTFENFMLENIQQKTPITEIKGAKRLVDYLRKNTDFAVCFATGSMRKPAEYKMNQVGIDFKPNLLVAANEIESREGIVQKAIDNAKAHYGVDFERVISLGDGFWDLTTAENLGLEFIGAGAKNQMLLEEHGARVLIDYSSLSSTMNLLNKRPTNL